MTKYFSALLILTCWLWCGNAAAEHPQTVWDATELERLRAARTTTHAALAADFEAYLDRYNKQPVTRWNVVGFALMTRVQGDRAADTANAVASLMQHCAAPWGLDEAGNAETKPDLFLSFDIFNGAIGYDVLHDLLTPEQRAICRQKIAVETKKMADAADAGIWWTTDLVQNHNWVNFAAIGVAGQALEGEDPHAEHWRELARLNFHKQKAVLDLVTDGSWHEGIGYLEFGLSRSLMYWLGAVRRGESFDKSTLLSQLGRYILYAQTPNQPRVHVMTHGDWNQSRPGLIPVLTWAARRFQDPFAQEAARRWNSTPRELKQDHGFAYALEYIAYDPQVPLPDMTQVPLDIYNEDQQSVIFRNSWDYGTDSDTLVVAFKSGVFGGRGNYERMRSCEYPGGILDFGHDHEDDLGLWIYGHGGWLLPEAVAYNCCERKVQYHSTPWHNTFLFDDVGQLGDDKTGTPEKPRSYGKECGIDLPGFYDREASMPLHVATAHYAFARGDGRRLYPASLGLTTLLRTVGFARENGGFIALQDRVVLESPRKIEQLFHSQLPAATHDDDHPWLKLANQQTALGVRVLSPPSYQATFSTQLSNNFRSIDDDGHFGLVSLTPATPQANMTFLEVLWPAKATDWNARPNIQPLDAANPQHGFSIARPASVESWIYNTSGATTAGDLMLEGNGQADDDAGAIGIKRAAADGTLERLVVQGRGKLMDRNGRRVLLDLGDNTGVLEVAFSGARAELSGTAETTGVRFYGPNVVEVLRDGQAVRWRREGDTVIL